jgi:hypothetical protein
VSLVRKRPILFRWIVCALLFSALWPPLEPGAATPTATPKPVSCNPSAAYVADLTVPNGTVLTAGQWFAKIWRLRNDGTCPWPPGSALAFVDGERMDEVSDPVRLLGAVPPGATTDIAVPMIVPIDPGEHDASWQMRDPLGRWFGPKVTVNIQSAFPLDVLAANKAKAPYILVAPREVGTGQDFKVKVVFRSGQPGGYWCVRAKVTATEGFDVDDPGTGSLDRTYGGEASELSFKVTAPSTVNTTGVVRASVQWSKGLGCDGPSATADTSAPVTAVSPWIVTVVATALCPKLPPKEPPEGVTFILRDAIGRLMPDGDQLAVNQKFTVQFQVPPRVATYDLLTGWTCLTGVPTKYDAGGASGLSYTLPASRQQPVTITGNNKTITVR